MRCLGVVRDRREVMPGLGPCCVCGHPTPKAETITGVVIPSCDIHYWTYLVGSARKASPQSSTGLGA